MQNAEALDFFLSFFFFCGFCESAVRGAQAGNAVRCRGSSPYAAARWLDADPIRQPSADGSAKRAKRAKSLRDAARHGTARQPRKAARACVPAITASILALKRAPLPGPVGPAGHAFHGCAGNLQELVALMNSTGGIRGKSDS